MPSLKEMTSKPPVWENCLQKEYQTLSMGYPDFQQLREAEEFK